MDVRKLLDFMALAEKLKCSTRHCDTSSGRRESVAEHTYRLCMMAWLVKDEFPDLDTDKLIRMCLFHDLGEAITGDIPGFEKNDTHRAIEKNALEEIAAMLPETHAGEFSDICREIEENQTPEAKLMHALDKMEAVIQHNESDIKSWLPLEYELQMSYGQEQAEAFEYTRKLRALVKEDSIKKIEESKSGK